MTKSRFSLLNFLLAFAFLFSMVISSCGTKNPLDINVSHIDVNITVERMDQKLFEARSADLKRVNRELYQSYGEMYEIYLSGMVRAGFPDDSLIEVSLDKFIHDPVMKQVYQDIQAQYADLSWLEEELEEAFRHLKFYFPDAEIPRVVVYNSVFNYGISTFENMIGIGLDMYLGPENRTVMKISNEVMPQYVKEKMRKEYIVVDAMRGWFELNFLEELESQDFLARIIYEGKILYALDALLPKTPDHLKIRYTADQYGWCLENETQIWKDIVDKKLLYSTDLKEIKRFCEDAPFTTGLPQNSPGRVGIWLGWQMVRAYMQEFPELKLPDLIQEKNPRKILKFYKPEKE